MDFYTIAEYIIGLASIYIFIRNIFEIKSSALFFTLSSITLAVGAGLSLFLSEDSAYGASTLLLLLGLTFLPCAIKGVKKYYLLFSSILFSGLIFFISSIYPLIMSIINSTLTVDTDSFLSLISNIFAMLVFVVLATLLRRKTVTFINSVSKLTIALITAFLYIGGMLNLMGTFIDSSTDYPIAVLKVTILAVSLIFLVSIPVLSYNQIKKSQYMYESRLYEQQLNAQLDYYQSIAESGYELRKFRHDYNNLSSGLRSLIKSDKPQDALLLIDKYDKRIVESFDIMYNTGCDIADAILTDKQQKARDNIKIRFEGNLNKVRTDNLDICVLLHNTLDIAINASEKCDGLSKQYITVQSSLKHGFLFYQITNPINGSQKQQSENKFAFDTLKKLVDKNNGVMNFSCTDNESTINIKYATA